MANNQLKEEIILSTEHFDQKINDVIKKVNKLQQQGNKVGGGFNKSMSSMIQKATGFNGSMTSLVGVVGKFAGGIGLAMSATEAFNETIHSSQTLEDEFGKIQASVTTLVDDFFSSLSTGDFSPFLNGIDSLINKARAAYDAMDDLWNMSLSFGVQNARLNNTFQKNLLEIRKLKGSKDPKDQQRMKQLIAENEKIIKKQAEGGAKLYNQTIKGLQAEIAAGTGMNSKISEDAIYRIVENDIDNLKGGRAKFDKAFKEYEKEKDRIQKKYSKKRVGGGFIDKVASAINPSANYGIGYQKEMNQLQSKYGEAIVANYLLQKKSDKELEEFVNILKQGIAYQGVAIANNSRLVRYTKETNAAGARGGSGGKKENPAEKVKRQLEDAINKSNILAQDLQDVQKNTLPSIEERFNNISVFDKLNAQRYQDMVKQGKGKFSFGDTGGEKTYNEEGIEVYFTVNEESVQDIYQKYDWLVGRIQEAMKNNEMGILSAEEVNATIDYINKELEKLGLKPLQLHVETDAEKALKETTSAIDALGSSFQGLGQALEVPALDVAGVMAQAIAAIIEGYAFATSEAGKALGPIGWLAFGAVGLAQLVNIISTVKSLGAYANGGIVGGSSYAGDRLYARVNSGEMILNSQQQSHLFNMINNGGGGVASTGEVQFVIKGSDLYGTLKNYDSKMKKVR